MHNDEWNNSEEMRRPGMRRVLEAMSAIEKERPGSLEQAELAVSEKANGYGDRGRTPEYGRL
jgi:hypothetical protein